MLFSIIIPVYNGERIIKKAIESVLSQSYSEWQLIIINDGSCDNTEDICKQFSEEDRVTYIKKNNSGVSDSRNIGVQTALGEYIVFLDADDWLEKDCLLKFHDVLQSEKCDLILSNYYTVDDEGQVQAKRFLKSVIMKEKDDINNLLDISLCAGRKGYEQCGNLHPVWANCYSRNFLYEHKVIFPQGLKIGEDMVFNLQCIKNANVVALLNEYVYNYQNNEDSVMHQQKWEGVEQGERYYYEAEAIVNGLVSETVLASLWLEVVEMDWIRILNSKIGLKTKINTLKELFKRPLYVRFCENYKEFQLGKRAYIYMYLVRNNMALWLLLILKVKLIKNRFFN